MKALSIRQPWAHLIVHCGKDVENRDWPTRYRGPLLIHAAARRPSAEDQFQIGLWLRERGIPKPATPLPLVYGAIVGIADLVDCVTASDSPWFMGRYGLVLANVRPLEPIPLRGARGLFDVDLPVGVLR